MKDKVEAASPWRTDVDYRRHPELYRVGRGEGGVFRCNPYKGELLPHWRFATPEQARHSSDTIFAMFNAYVAAGDFVGADLARKYLQMGYTRATRYARRKSGRKYTEYGALLPSGTGDAAKAECAAIFKTKWKQAEADEAYRAWRAARRERSAPSAQRHDRGAKTPPS